MGEGGHSTAKPMLLAPHSWEVELLIVMEGMEPATRYVVKEDLELHLRTEDLGISGDKIPQTYLLSQKTDATKYTIQGIEWWYTVAWSSICRVQITRPPR